jgi:hypothetical protein
MTETPPSRLTQGDGPETSGPDPHASLNGAPAPPPRSRAASVAAAVVGVLALGGGALWYGLGSRGSAPVPASPADVVAVRLAEAKDYAPFFDGLAARLPADSAQIRESLARRAQGEPDSAADRFVADALKALRETRGVAAAKADAPAMARVFAAQGAMLAGLREADPKLCVDFVYGGATDALMSFAAGHRPLFAEVASANLDAILDGGEKKIARDEPTDEDFATLEKALRDKGLGDAEIGALLDGKTPDPPLPDAAMCDAARAYVSALLALPEPTRSRVMALAIELMARS